MSQNTSSAVMAQRREPAGEWRPIAGWPGYEVSDQGRVRSWKWPGKDRKWVADYGRGARILSQETRNGYGSVLLSDISRGNRHESVHVLVLETFIGPRPEGHQAAHNDGNRSNCRLSNLRWSTPRENNADKIRHGTLLRGERVASSKLTTDQVEQIRVRHGQGERRGCLAAEFRVHPNTIWHITSGRYWRAAL